MFFSRETRPTYMNTGLRLPNMRMSYGRNSSVSTPRVHGITRSKPRRINSLASDGVATIVPAPALWK